MTTVRSSSERLNARTRIRERGRPLGTHAAPLHSCKYRWLHAPAPKDTCREKSSRMTSPSLSNRRVRTKVRVGHCSMDGVWLTPSPLPLDLLLVSPARCHSE